MGLLETGTAAGLGGIAGAPPPGAPKLVRGCIIEDLGPPKTTMALESLFSDEPRHGSRGESREHEQTPPPISHPTPRSMPCLPTVTLDQHSVDKDDADAFDGSTQDVRDAAASEAAACAGGKSELVMLMRSQGELDRMLAALAPWSSGLPVSVPPTASPYAQPEDAAAAAAALPACGMQDGRVGEDESGVKESEKGLCGDARGRSLGGDNDVQDDRDNVNGHACSALSSAGFVDGAGTLAASRSNGEDEKQQMRDASEAGQDQLQGAFGAQSQLQGAAERNRPGSSANETLPGTGCGVRIDGENGQARGNVVMARESGSACEGSTANDCEMEARSVDRKVTRGKTAGPASPTSSFVTASANASSPERSTTSGRGSGSFLGPLQGLAPASLHDGYAAKATSNCSSQ